MLLLIHLPRVLVQEIVIDGISADFRLEKELKMVNFFRNILVMGALMGFAKFVAKDKRIVG